MAVVERKHPLDPDQLRRDLAGPFHEMRAHQVKFPAYAAQGVFCPVCAIERRVTIQLLYAGGGNAVMTTWPVMAQVHCLQCQTNGVIVGYQGPEGDSVTVHWPQFAGLATPNTPESVAYYLDEAARCESAGANSAAVAMYRAALDHLMFDQGYKGGMLGKRIAALLDDVKDGKGPKWAREIEHEFLDVIKRLGDGAIHTNDGDVTKQDELDSGVLAELHVMFATVLEIVYERPAKDAARLAKLKATADKLKK